MYFKVAPPRPPPCAAVRVGPLAEEADIDSDSLQSKVTFSSEVSCNTSLNLSHRFQKLLLCGASSFIIFFCSRNKEDSRKDCFSLPAASEGSAIVARITRSFRNEFQDKGRRSDDDLTNDRPSSPV